MAPPLHLRRLTVCTVVATILVGCAGDATEPAGDTAVAVTPWVYEPGERPAALLDAGTLGPELTDALGVVASLDPRVAFDAYDAALLHGDADCPTVDPDYGFQYYWEGGCDSGDGTAFDGWGLSQRMSNVPVDDMMCSNVGFYYGFARITTADPTGWSGWGQLDWDECQDRATGDIWLYGGYRGDFEVAGDGWLAEGLSLSLSTTATRGTDGGRTVTLSGSLSGLSGAMTAVWFDGVVLGDASVTGACAIEPAGHLVAWDTAGVEYDVQFDDDVGPDDAACDGCGALTIDGVASGQACVDVSPLLSWEERPWE